MVARIVERCAWGVRVMMMNGSYPARLGIEAPLQVKNWRPLGKHVEGLRSFLIGVSRWSWRVSAYSGLLRDEYPPFSLEDGSLGSAPAVTTGGPPPQAPAGEPIVPPPPPPAG